MDQEKKPKLTPVLTMLETAIKVWWKNLKKIITVYLWGLAFALIPLIIILALAGIDTFLGERSPLSFQIFLAVVSVAGIFLALYFAIRAYLGIFLLVKKNYEGQELAIYKETKKIFWPYIGLALLSTVLILLWTLLLIIPGIIYSVFYCLAVYVFFFEDKRGMAAIRRSIKLVSDYWWPVFGRVIVVALLMWVIIMLISLPLSYIAKPSFLYYFWSGLVQVVNMVIGPIVLLFTYQIYQELVKIKQ